LHASVFVYFCFFISFSSFNDYAYLKHSHAGDVRSAISATGGLLVLHCSDDDDGDDVRSVVVCQGEEVANLANDTTKVGCF